MIAGFSNLVGEGLKGLGLMQPEPKSIKEKTLFFLKDTVSSIKEKATPYYFQAKHIVSPYYHETLDTVNAAIQSALPTVETVKSQLPFIGGVSALIAGTTLLASGTSQIFASKGSKKAATAKILTGAVSIGLGTYALAPIVKPLFDTYIDPSRHSKSLEELLADYKVHICKNDEKAQQSVCFSIAVE